MKEKSVEYLAQRIATGTILVAVVREDDKVIDEVLLLITANSLLTYYMESQRETVKQGSQVPHPSGQQTYISYVG